MSSGEIEISGFDELDQQLVAAAEILGVGVTNRAVRRAGRAAFRGALDTARRLCVKKDGTQDRFLAASTRLAVQIPKSGEDIMRVGLKCAKGRVEDEDEEVDAIQEQLNADGVETDIRKVNAGWRWHFSEFGTAKMAARPFLRPAFDKHVSEMLEAFGTGLSAALVAELEKAKRKAAK